MASSFLQAAKMQFTYYKSLGDKTINQLSDADLFVKPANDCTNSIAIILLTFFGLLTIITSCNIFKGKQ